MFSFNRITNEDAMLANAVVLLNSSCVATNTRQVMCDVFDIVDRLFYIDEVLEAS